MNPALASLVGASAASVLGLGAVRAHRAWRRFRGTRVLPCPRSGRSAAVEVDRALAALTAPFGRPLLRTRACSRWWSEPRCAEECLPAIAAAPEAHLVRSLLRRWSVGRPCAICGSSLPAGAGARFEPALLAADGRTLDHRALPPEALPDALASHRPVCWYCHVVETLRREQPHLVVATGAAPLRRSAED